MTKKNEKPLSRVSPVIVLADVCALPSAILLHFVFYARTCKLFAAVRHIDVRFSYDTTRTIGKPTRCDDPRRKI